MLNHPGFTELIGHVVEATPFKLTFQLENLVGVSCCNNCYVLHSPDSSRYTLVYNK